MVNFLYFSCVFLCVREWSWSPWILTGVRHMGLGEGSYAQASRQHPVRPKQPWRAADSRARASGGRGRCTAPTLSTCLMRWLPWFWQVGRRSHVYERYQINTLQKHPMWSTHPRIRPQIAEVVCLLAWEKCSRKEGAKKMCQAVGAIRSIASSFLYLANT